MSRKIAFALIGAGGIAGTYAAALNGHPDAELAGVLDVRPSAAETLAVSTPGCRAFTEMADLLDGPAFDAVIVCTPPSTHERIATVCLESGKHVLCEKPFTIGGASARRMRDRAESCRRTLTMASKFRYVKDVIAAKRLIDGGLIGDIARFDNTFTANVDMSNRWNSNPAVSGGGVLIDNGAHSFDLTRYFLGQLVDLHAVEGGRPQHLAVEDSVQVFIHSRAGVMGTVELSWSVDKQKETFLDIAGSLGVLSVGWKASKYRLTATKETVTFGGGYDKVQAFADQIGNFARHIRDGETLVVNIDDAIANVDAIDAAYQSMGLVKWTPVGQAVTA